MPRMLSRVIRFSLTCRARMSAARQANTTDVSPGPLKNCDFTSLAWWPRRAATRKAQATPSDEIWEIAALTNTIRLRMT